MNGFRVGRSLLIFSFAIAAFLLVVDVHDVLAQARNPFSVGISEGGGQATGVTGWILARQIEFERMISGAVRATPRTALIQPQTSQPMKAETTQE